MSCLENAPQKIHTTLKMGGVFKVRLGNLLGCHFSSPLFSLCVQRLFLDKSPPAQ